MPSTVKYKMQKCSKIACWPEWLCCLAVLHKKGTRGLLMLLHMCCVHSLLDFCVYRNVCQLHVVVKIQFYFKSSYMDNMHLNSIHPAFFSLYLPTRTLFISSPQLHIFSSLLFPSLPFLSFPPAPSLFYLVCPSSANHIRIGVGSSTGALVPTNIHKPNKKLHYFPQNPSNDSRISVPFHCILEHLASLRWTCSEGSTIERSCTALA